MKGIGQCLGVRIVGFIKLHGVPAVLTPILPVLNYHADGHLLLFETASRLKNLLRAMETLTTVDISQCPAGYLRTVARQLAIGGDDFVRSTDKHSIIDSGSHWRTENGLVLYLIII